MLIDKLLNRLEYHFIVFRNSNVLPIEVRNILHAAKS